MSRTWIVSLCNGNSFLLFNFFYFFRLSFSLHKWQPLAALWSIFSQIVIANIFVLSKVAKFFKFHTSSLQKLQKNFSNITKIFIITPYIIQIINIINVHPIGISSAVFTVIDSSLFFLNFHSFHWLSVSTIIVSKFSEEG